MADRVTIIEVSPRDGLQNEPLKLSVEERILLINKLKDTGLKHIEVGAFVSPKYVPQMADSDMVLSGLDMSDTKIHYPVLVPNMHGFEAAEEAGAREIAIFASASEAFSQKNINCSRAESLARFTPIMAAAKMADIKVRGYVSCVLGCPYEGEVEIAEVAKMAKALYEMGCYEISLGDTIGVGTPTKAREMVREVAEEVPIENIAGHFHDTYGQALANIYAVMEDGVRIFDSAVAGLGGCPYARGASGNVATEDLIYMLNGMGLETGIDLGKLIEVGQWISDLLRRQNMARLGKL